jgi:hypothetical protein
VQGIEGGVAEIIENAGEARGVDVDGDCRRRREEQKPDVATGFFVTQLLGRGAIYAAKFTGCSPTFGPLGQADERRK